MSDVNANPTPQWYGDPTGRADYRYWDGGAWSTWVASGGSARVDDEPLAADVPPPPPVLPPGIPMPPVAGTGYGRATYLSLKGLSVALTWLAGFEMLACLVRVGTLVNALVKLDDFDDFSTFARYDEWRDAHDAAGSAMGWILILAIPIFVVLIILMYRASTNTVLWIAGRPRWAPGWTIGGWFIPLAWFVIPCLVMCEIWRRSTPSGVKPGIARVVWWWVLFAVGFVASLGVGPDTLSEYRAQYSANLVGAVLLVIAAALFVAMVRELNRRQQSLEGAPRIR
jgi:Domain of unknown function (DUF4328)